MQQTIQLYSLTYRDLKTYVLAMAFIGGNILVPQLFHLVPQGGVIWLPIYLFTLVGAYKYGWRMGLLTAVCSPLLNHLLFGMPMQAALPAILLKSVLLALAAGFAAYRFQRVSILLLTGVVLAYQLLGTLGEWMLTGSIYQAIQDFRIGIPGLMLQIFGGYGIIHYLIRK